MDCIRMFKENDVQASHRICWCRRQEKRTLLRYHGIEKVSPLFTKIQVGNEVRVGDMVSVEKIKTKPQNMATYVYYIALPFRKQKEKIQAYDSSIST